MAQGQRGGLVLERGVEVAMAAFKYPTVLFGSGGELVVAGAERELHQCFGKFLPMLVFTLGEHALDECDQGDAAQPGVACHCRVLVQRLPAAVGRPIRRQRGVGHGEGELGVDASAHASELPGYARQRLQHRINLIREPRRHRHRLRPRRGFCA